MLKNRTYNNIFDIHVHLLGDSPLDGEFLAYAKSHGMRFGISCLGPYGEMIAQPTIDECRQSNDMVARLCREHRDLAYGFSYVNPVHGEAAVDEIRRCLDIGMVGIKLWLGCPCNDERVFPIAEEAIRRNIPILQHTWIRDPMLPGESSPWDVAELAQRYPEVTIIMAHMAYRWRQGVQVVKDLPNVLVDCSGGDTELGQIEHAVEILGAERVLFGSDAPGRDILLQLSKVTCSEISEEHKVMILRSNAERLLKTAQNRGEE